MLWLIWWTARGSGKIAPEETTHVWDDDLTEFNHPLPRWWLWMFIMLALWAWSSRRKELFDAMARMPLEEDAEPASRSEES
jgi:cbb3-type cytochrome oxidase subunit 3